MSTTSIPILLYHSISDRPAAGQERFTVTSRAFAEHVHAIRDSGRTALTVGELASRWRGEAELPSRPVVVTFDDGFADAQPAVELLLGAGLAASVFVTSGWLGREGMLTHDGLRKLAALGGRVEVGAHTATHPRLDELRNARLREEIWCSKAALEDVVQMPLRSFAYPHGAYDRRVRRAVIEAGFSAAAAVKNAISHSEDDPYALARVTIGASTSVRHVEMLLGGSGAPLAWRGERLRTRSHRRVRRLRRALGRPLA